jgi:hypothetical protein
LPHQIRQIGIRSVDAGEKRFLAEIGIEVFDMRYVDEVGMRATMEQALAGICPENAPACQPRPVISWIQKSRPGWGPRCEVVRPIVRRSYAWK